MKIIEAGNIMCDCGNDELVFVRALPPLQDHYLILCRKCKAKGCVRLEPASLITYPMAEEE